MRLFRSDRAWIAERVVVARDARAETRPATRRPAEYTQEAVDAQP
ncbi:MAG: hypothetical protein ABEJ73_01990 [Haloplanus sp.]